jgi:hypothetical protein
MHVSIQSYPATRYGPGRPPDFASKTERQRLTPSALKAFFNIIECWKIRDEDARQLLGGISNGPYYQIKKDPEARRMLNADLLSRISYLIGIFKALNTSMLGRLPTSGCAFQIPTASLAALVLWTI